MADDKLIKAEKDKPYFRTVPSSPEPDEASAVASKPSTKDRLGSEKIKEIETVVSGDSGETDPKNAEEDEESRLRRKLLEKRVQREQEKKHEEHRMEQKSAHKDRPASSRAEPPKRERITFHRDSQQSERHRPPSISPHNHSSRGYGKTSSAKNSPVRSQQSRTTNLADERKRRRYEEERPGQGIASHHRQPPQRRDEPPSLPPSKFHHRTEKYFEERFIEKGGRSGSEGGDVKRHHSQHREREYQQQRHHTTVRIVERREKERERSPGERQHREKESASRRHKTEPEKSHRSKVTEKVAVDDETVSEKDTKVEKEAENKPKLEEDGQRQGGDVDEVSLYSSASSASTRRSSVSSTASGQPKAEQPQQDVPAAEEQVETASEGVATKRMKYSKFESSPEEEEEIEEGAGEEGYNSAHTSDDELDEGKKTEKAKEPSKFNEPDFEMMDLSNEQPDYDELIGQLIGEKPLANTNTSGTTENTKDNDVLADLLENKEFDELTAEEKALLSPETLRAKEARWKQRLISQLPVYYPGISGCRSVSEYNCDHKISEGTFGVVYKATEKRTDSVVALKRLKMEKEHQGFPITSLREINMLLKCGTHPNVVNVREVVVGSNMDKIYLVMDYVEHDMKALMEMMKKRNKKFTIPQVKTLMLQLLRGVEHMHEQYVIHRDLKTSNLLLSNQGVLKIGDFGLAREFGDPIKPYTPVVVTLWYRSPELLLGTKVYSTPVDCWSVGCIFGEFLKLDPMFPGRGEVDQMNKIFKDIGTPNERIWPGCSQLPGMKHGNFAEVPFNQLRKKFASELSDDAGFELMNQLLAACPDRRLTVTSALKSRWFTNEPRPALESSFPTWPTRGGQDLHHRPVINVEELAAKTAEAAGQPRPTAEKMSLIKELKVDVKQAAKGGFSLKFDAPKFK